MKLPTAMKYISVSSLLCLSQAVAFWQQPSQGHSLHQGSAATKPNQGPTAFLKSNSNHSLDNGYGNQPARHKEKNGYCFNAAVWLAQFVPPVSNRIGYSQGNQDAVLASLFSEANLGFTQRYCVEFGFNTKAITANSNVGLLVERLGFTHLLIDGGWKDPALHLHQRMLSQENVANVFKELGVPQEVDYVSIDIDSCELWMFMEIAKTYRPRVISVEYNCNYPLGNYTTQKCQGSAPWLTYSWGGDNIYGASLSALVLAAKHRGYVPVYVTSMLDLFLVREDLICAGTAPAIQTFAANTGITNGVAYEVRAAVHHLPPASELLMDFNQWLIAHPDA